MDCNLVIAFLMFNTFRLNEEKCDRLTRSLILYFFLKMAQGKVMEAPELYAKFLKNFFLWFKVNRMQDFLNRKKN